MTEAAEKAPILNRELSWMDFNLRVLEEAIDRENPLMERLRFLAITASNLDEFFMVRVAGVKAQVNSGYTTPDVSGLTPEKLLAQLTEKIRVFVDRQYSCLHRSIEPMLKRNSIAFLEPEQWDAAQKRFIREYFERVLSPVLTPLAVDTSRPFPKLANKSLNIALRLEGGPDEGADGKAEEHFAVVQVPSLLSRFLEIPAQEGRAFALLEDVITAHLSELFELYEIRTSCVFRITRNADLEIDEEAEDLMVEIERSIKKRKRGRPVRLELLQKCDPALRKFLTEMLRLKKEDVFPVSGPIDLTFFSKFASLPGFGELCFQPVRPVSPPAAFRGEPDIFAAIRERDRLVHHPYESFDSVLEFIRRAAEDENVLAIKQTLYRVSGHSPIIASLIRAAENGKQVTVLVELKARFDEENNIQWAKLLEEAGCHVVYGLAGLKTHCKIALVVRQEEDGIRRYLHLGTGNYNESTAKIYTDIGLFTCRELYGADASSLFNVLTGYSRPPEYHKFAVAPHGLRDFMEKRILREIENGGRGLPCGITAKVNSLVDPRIIRLLYQASQAGVPVKLVVRGICCLIAGVPGISENITVVSVVGQLLEHSRIFRFENGGDPKLFLGSADWMQRNLDRRVELVFPVEDESLRARVEEVLELLLSDNWNARYMQPDGTYQQASRRGKAAVNCHRVFADRAAAAAKEIDKLTEGRPVELVRQKPEDPVRSRQ